MLAIAKPTEMQEYQIRNALYGLNPVEQKIARELIDGYMRSHCSFNLKVNERPAGILPPKAGLANLVAEARKRAAAIPFEPQKPKEEPISAEELKRMTDEACAGTYKPTGELK